MSDITEYKPLALVFYIDWNWNRNALPLEEEKIPQFKKALEECKMVEIEWVVINTFDIKEIRPSQFTTEVEKYYYSRDIAERKYITDRVRKIVRNPKANVIEEIMWYNDPVKTMDSWICSKFYSELPTKVVWKDMLWDDIREVNTEELTYEQKEQIKSKFKDLQNLLKKQPII